MSDRIYIGSRKGLFRADRAGGQWKITAAAFLGDHVTLVLPDTRDGSLYAALYHGHFGVKLHRSKDAGQSWEEIAVPEYPPRPDDAEDKDQWGKPLPWKLNMIWALAAGHADHDNEVWCGTIPGGLFRSPDAGQSWQLMTGLWNHPKRKEWFGGGADLPGVHSVCVHPQNGKHIGVGVSCGGFWVTTDGGDTWNCQADGMRAEYMPPERQHDPNIQDPHCVVQCRDHPDYYWAQHHNGVFRSTDGAASWQEIENMPPANFGFPVAVHPREPDTAWFVPGVKDECRIPVDVKVVVSRTRDGGKSFDVLREGLPQEHAYDLTFRHALDVDESGDRLAFGSTTGSGWISENQGDSWIALSHHLPPIYCVRFSA